MNQMFASRHINSVVEPWGSVVIFCIGVASGSVGTRCGGRVEADLGLHVAAEDGRRFQAFPAAVSENTR